MSGGPELPPIGPDIDLDVEEVYMANGERLTEARAEALAEELLVEHRRHATEQPTICIAHAYRDETGAWCARVEALHANTDAESFVELRANLADAVAVSIDPPAAYVIELYVHVDDVDAAAEEMRRAS